MKSDIRVMIRVVVLVIFLMGCAGELRSTNAGASQGETGLDLPAPTPNPPPAPDAKPEPARWEASASGFRAWTEYLFEILPEAGPDLLQKSPADIRQFCPNFEALSLNHKKDFWIYLVSSIAQFESSFNPALSYTENFTDSTGQLVVSRGLLQLSIESARAYGCDLPSAQDLHDPFRNLLCGLKILNRWVGSDGVIRGQNSGGTWRGGARYWSVLRRDTQYNSIRSWTSSQPYCN